MEDKIMSFEAITEDELKKFKKEFAESKSEAVQGAVMAQGIPAVSINKSVEALMTHQYSINVESGDITNQKRSGRCWMFAATNVMRLEVMKKLKIKNMELSQAYPLFWDKLEKSNFFLENILKTIDEPNGSRITDFLLSSPIGDGGQWTMFVNLVEKYGVCPKDVYPETASSSNTQAMDKYITLKLREDACTLRKLHQEEKKTVEELRPLKEKMLSEVYHILAVCLGEPPVKFTYEYVDEDKKFGRIADITPKEFFDKYVGLKLDDYVSVLSCPGPRYPFEKAFTVKYLNNVEGGNKVLYINLPIERVKELVIKQLSDNRVVWFGSDVGQFSYTPDGVMSTEMWNVNKVLGTEFGMTKAERVDYGESLMTHAMVITGVNIVDNKPNRWRVENSWGDAIGDKGYFVMSDDWFNEFVYQAVIDKKYLTEDEVKILEQDPIELEAWDPMGSLAL